MDLHFNLVFLLTIAAVVVLLILLGLLILAIRSGKGKSAPRPASMPSAKGPSREQREAILQRLADGELTQEQAENELGQLGTPVPDDMPAPPPTRSGGKGCLVALIIALLIIPLLILGIFALFWRDSVPSQRYDQWIIEPAPAPVSTGPKVDVLMPAPVKEYPEQPREPKSNP